MRTLPWPPFLPRPTDIVHTEWTDAYTHLRTALGLPTDEPIPKLPRPAATATVTITDSTNGAPPHADGKRKAPSDTDADTDMEPAATDAEASKRAKTDGAAANGHAAAGSPEEIALAHARATALYIPFLSPDHLVPPKMPTREEMEQFLLGLRKKALVEEYFGEQEA